MPIGMTYCWNQNTLSVDSSTGLSGYGEPSPQKTQCQVYTWGNVDAFGSMALIWIPSTIKNTTVEITGYHLDKATGKQVPDQKIVEHALSGWHSCSNRSLIP